MDEQAEAPSRRYTTAETLARVNQARAELEALVAPLTEAQITAPGGPDGWAVKDHLAHLAAWYGSLLALLAGGARYEAVGLDKAAYAAMDTDAINAHLYGTSKDLPLAAVLAGYRQADQRVLDALAGMSDDDLYRPYSHYQPNDPPNDPNPVINWISGNTFGHIEEHLEWIRDLLASYPG